MDMDLTLNRHYVGVSLFSPPVLPDKQTRGAEPVLVLCWASLADGGPELDQHWVNVACLPGVLRGHICVLHITWCEDIKTVAQLIEPKNDLATVDHLPGSKS